MQIDLRENLDRAELDSLLNLEANWYLSLYMPTAKAGSEIRQNSIRYKNLLKQIQDSIKDREIWETISSVEGEPDFWNTQLHGLAVLGTPDLLRLYRLPMALPELVRVNTHFHLRPLLPFLNNNGSFLVLTIDQQEIRLWLGSHFDKLVEIPLPDLPTSFEDYLATYDIKAEIQFRGGHFGGSGNQGLFHGHGDVTVKEETEIKHFLQHFDGEISNLLKEFNLPLVIAGVESILPLYLEANTYKLMIGKGIDVQPESISEDKLRQKAWELVEPYYQASQQQYLAEIGEQSHVDRVTNELARILQDSFQGKVKALFVSPQAERWGYFNPDTQAVDFHQERQADSQDLYDTAVEWVLKRGGDVYLDEDQSSPPITALLRY